MDWYALIHNGEIIAVREFSHHPNLMDFHMPRFVNADSEYEVCRCSIQLES